MVQITTKKPNVYLQASQCRVLAVDIDNHNLFRITSSCSHLKQKRIAELVEFAHDHDIFIRKFALLSIINASFAKS